jgi:MarR family transcriptional regulator, organic hydroperoxide resistance regulator
LTIVVETTIVTDVPAKRHTARRQPAKRAPTKRPSSAARRAPEPHLPEQVFLALWRTADALTRRPEALLKSVGLSGTQYNVLRILRGAGAAGLACREVGCRLISRDPDITRLLDRLETRGLITRTREQKDRRVVKTYITGKGLQILAKLDAPVQEMHRRQLRHLPPAKLRQLSRLLELARTPQEAPRPRG